MSEGTNLINRTDEATATISASLASLQQHLGIGTDTIDLAALFRQGKPESCPRSKPLWQINLGPSPDRDLGRRGTLNHPSVIDLHSL